MTSRSLLKFAVLGAAALGQACSDPPPRPAKLGLLMTLRTESIPETQGRSCGAGSGITWDLGSPSPTSNDPGGTWEHETHDSNIVCTVRSGGQFQARGGGRDPQIASGMMPELSLVNFTFSGSGKTGSEAQASVYTTATFSVGTAQGFPPCTLTNVHEQKAGAIWADYTCPALTDSTRPNVACRAFGTLVLEYCQTGEEDE